jgi:hypothetical protein
VVKTYGPRYEVGELEASGVGSLRHHDEFKEKEAGVLGRGIAKTAKREFEFLVFFASTALDDYRCLEVGLPFGTKIKMNSLQAFLHGEVINSRKLVAMVVRGKGWFVYDDGDDCHRE